MRGKAELQAIDLDHEPTWRARNSKFYRAIARVRRQRLEDLHAQLDALLYGKGLEANSVKVVDTVSDHRAIVATFMVTAQQPS